MNHALVPVVAALFLLLGGPAGASSQLQLSPEHAAIDFLVGQWHTTSEFPDGRIGEGDLEYRWVLEGAWMRVEFTGNHPDGALWEAHVMQRWNPESAEYESWVFPAQGAPMRYRGSAPRPGMFRVEYTGNDGATTGIDYHRTPDSAVRQENWIEVEGERRVTLRTTYRAVSR